MMVKKRQEKLEKFRKDKKAQEMSTNTIIFIILGIAILVVLIIGFTIGWEKILPFINPVNVDDVRNGCSVACTTNSQYNYCFAGKKLKSDSEELKEVTCNFLLQKRSAYGIESCSSISCDTVTLVDIGQGETIDNKCTGNEGKIIQGLVGDTLITKECPAVSGQPSTNSSVNSSANSTA